MRLNIIALITVLSSVAFSNPKVIVTCRGFTTTDSQAVKFTITSDTQGAIGSAPKLTIYTRDLVIPGSVDFQLFHEPCAEYEITKTSITCSTPKAGQILIDLTKGSAVNSGVNAQGPYYYEFPICE